MSKYRVYYMRPEFFRDGCMGPDWLRENDKLPVTNSPLDATHIHLMDREAPSLSRLFWNLQGEVWSRKGEAKPLIERKGLAHTSMSVGDIAVDENDVAYMVDRLGFCDLGKIPAEQPIS